MRLYLERTLLGQPLSRRLIELMRVGKRAEQAPDRGPASAREPAEPALDARSGMCQHRVPAGSYCSRCAPRDEAPRVRVSLPGRRLQAVLGYVPGRGGVRLEATTQREALAEWNELRGKAGGGEVIPKRNVKLAPVAEEWLERKQRNLRSSTITGYREALDLVVLPLFGQRRLVSNDADAISKVQFGLKDRGLNYVDRTRPAQPLSRSRVNQYMKPLRGIMRYAVRHKLIPANPFDVLTEDDQGRCRALRVRVVGRRDREGARRRRGTRAPD